MLDVGSRFVKQIQVDVFMYVWLENPGVMTFVIWLLRANEGMSQA